LYRIMFVCHGNICRSPMAEFIFKKLIKDHGLSDQFYVSSSATSTEEIYGGIGNPVYPPARVELARHGISCDDKRAIQLQASDADKYDLFVGMDSENIRNMHRILPPSSHHKIKKLMDYTNRCGDVADPWYSDRFDIAFSDIWDGCQSLLLSLKNDILRK